MDWGTSVTDKPDLKVVPLFNSEKDVVTSRINGLHYILSIAQEDYVPHVYCMLIALIEESYEGEYIDNSTARLKESLAWWNASQKV